MGADFDCAKVRHMKGLCVTAGRFILGRSKAFFEQRTSTGSDVFFILVHLDATKFVIFKCLVAVASLNLKLLVYPLFFYTLCGTNLSKTGTKRPDE